MSIRVLISDTVLTGHPESVRAGVLAGYGAGLTAAEVAIEAHIVDDGIEIPFEAAAALGAEIVVRGTTEIAQYEATASAYYPPSNNIIMVMPLGSNSSVELTPLSEIPLIVACGAGVTENQTGYGAGLEFWDEDLDTSAPALSSYSTGRIAGKLLKIKTELGCTWAEARAAARATASNGGTWDKYNGYGKINVAAAILGYIPMEFTVSTRTITGADLALASGDVGKVAQFYDTNGVAYSSTILSVTSPTECVLYESDELPTSSIQIYDLELVGDGETPSTIADYAIVTLAEVKAYLGDSSTTNDILLQSWINDVSQNIEDETGQTFKVRTFSDEIYDGNGLNYMNTVHAPVYGPKTTLDWSADVLYRVDPVDPWQAVETEKAYIYVKTDEPFKVCLYRQTFPRGPQTVKLSYQAGYAVIPADIKRLAIEKVAMMWNESKKGNDRLGKSHVSVNIAGGSDATTYIDMQKRWSDVITQYRRAL